MALPAIFSRLPASMTCCVFFAVINDAGDYPILSDYRACRDARRRVETGVSPCQKGGVGGHPYSLAYFPLCFVVVRRSLGHALNVRSLLRACHASPTEKYTALTHIRAYTRNRFFAYQPQATRRREPPPMPFAHCRLPCFRCWALCFVVVRRSLGHALNVRSLLRAATHRLPKNILHSPTFARARATDSSHTSHRLPGGVSRRRCPSHTTAAKPL